MKLSIKNFAITCSVFWSLAVLIVNAANYFWPDYGVSFLTVIASIYPGYEAMQGIGSIIVGSLYALVDAGIGGALFAWIYNKLSD
jgi:hypothetical protein